MVKRRWTLPTLKKRERYFERQGEKADNEVSWTATRRHLQMSMDTIKNIFRKSSIGTIIFFILNALVIVGLFSGTGYEGMLTILVLYIVSIIIALSPFGEWVLCLMVGTRKMTRIDMKNRILPLLNTVYRRAKIKTPGLVDNVDLRVMYTPEPNAYAIGRRTVCVTEGLFSLPDDEIRGILAHEVGHLACRHTEIQLIIGGGNFIVTMLIFLIKFVAALIAAFSLYSGYSNRSWAPVIIGLILAAIIWLWTRFCLLFLMWSMRENEFVADVYAAELGYGYELAKGLDAIGTSKPQDSFLRALYSTHPNAHDRIGRLQQMGVPYFRY
jgi:heat shock protein HtpX